MENGNERVYIGLPDRLVEDVFWVGRTYRTNSLSHIEGGSDIIVEHQDGSV
ncbi:MAG: hypothetical protein PPP56_04695 [Longimonas sp.]|uniref:hypothetical protein n=1 Tax=Longimonas sp. TaxID=2039626 RepID=UPI0033453D10